MSVDHPSHLWVKDTLIAPAEKTSGVKFGQAQAALARQWVYDSVDGDMPTEVTIKTPEPTSEGLFLTEKTTVKTEKYRIPASYDEAVTMIEQFEHSASALGGTRYAAVADTVGQHALQDKTRLADEQWFGTKEEELDSYVISLIPRRPAPEFHVLSRYVSELAYIHSKIMIVDDRRVIVSMSPVISCSNSLILS
jgi:phospholipase D1/2